jgi:integrase
VARGSIKKNEGKRGVSYTVVVDVNPGMDKRKQKKKTFKTKRDAEKWLNETINQVEKGLYIEPAKMTLGDWLKSWLKNHCEQNLAGSTLPGYRIAIEKHLIPALGVIPLKDLKPIHIKEYHVSALESGRKDGKVALGQKLSPTTVSQHHRILKHALKHALELEMIARNPADAVKPPKKVESRIEFLPLEDALRIVELCRGSYMFMPVYLALALGARRSEILGLRWGDVDFRNRVVHITRGLYRTKEKGTFFDLPKTKTSIRSITFFPDVEKELKAWKTQQKEVALAAGLAGEFNDQWLICSLEDGTPLVPGTVSSRFSKIAKKAGVDVTYHGFRHAHASYCLKLGIHPKVVSERLGHSNISITMDLYSHLAPTLQMEAADKLEGILGSK